MNTKDCKPFMFDEEELSLPELTYIESLLPKSGAEELDFLIRTSPLRKIKNNEIPFKKINKGILPGIRSPSKL